MTAPHDVTAVDAGRQGPARRGVGPAMAVAALLAVVVVGGGAAAGALAVRGAAAPGTPDRRAGLEGAEGFVDVFIAILVLNLPVAASLSAGIISVGAITALTGLMLGLYLGSTIGAAVNTVGAGALWDSVSAYAGIEMVGLAMAAVAGFLPLALALMSAGRGRPSGFPRYRAALPAAAALTGGSVLVLIVAAAIEAAVIAAAV